MASSFDSTEFRKVVARVRQRRRRRSTRLLISGGNKQTRAALKAAFDRLQSSGVTNLFHLPGEHLLGDDGEGTTDGSHPNDLGFQRQAEVFSPVLAPRLTPAR